MNTDTSGRPTAKGIVIAIAVGCVFTVMAAEGILRVAMPHWREFYSGWFMRTVQVPDHGVVTTGRPGFDGYFAQNNGDFRVRITVNNFGLRNPEPAEAAANRVWFVGDSMTFGWGVERDEIYSAIAGRLVNAPTYNVASPGTDVCGYQALVARMPENARPRAVVIGLILENDISAYDCQAAAAKSKAARKPDADWTQALSVHNVKRFLGKYTALYNFFAVSLKRVAFVREALGELGLIKKSHTFRQLFSESQFEIAIERTAAEIKALRSMLPGGIPFAVLIVPARFEVRDGDPFFRRLRLGIGVALTKRGIATIDPIEKFLSAGFQPTHFAYDGHWSRLGHRVAGRAAAVWLGAQGIGN
jgi:hypothetical protein